MDDLFLKKIIQDRIQECEWIDYKQKWHDNNVELLRDILSFVNTTHHKDCYLIFGIEDSTLNIIGVEDDPNRKKTQNILDFLGSKLFSTETPQVIVETLFYNDKEIDVLTVKNTNQVPVFLTKGIASGNKRCAPGQVFTRIGDTNTAIDKTAEDFVVEKLYKKRFNLDKTIYERYRYLVEQIGDWTYIDTEQKLLYNYDPNFYILIISYDEEDEARRIHTGDYHSWLAHRRVLSKDWVINEYNHVYFMYGEHKIFDVAPLLYFDRRRGITICPRLGELGHGKLSYMYLLKDSLSWKFMDLLSTSWDKCMRETFYSAHYSAKTVFDNVVVYENDEELEYIEAYYDVNSTIKDVERDFGYIIAPTQEELLELEQKNPKFTKTSLIRNNIAKAINKKLKKMRKYD